MAFFGILKHHGLANLTTQRTPTQTEDRGTPGATYPSVDVFYAAGGERRTLSIEHDFGVMWREGTRRRPRYRVSWIEATGELYAGCPARRFPLPPLRRLHLFSAGSYSLQQIAA